MNLQDLNKDELEWLERYHKLTTFEPIGIEDATSFQELKQINLRWFELRFTEVFCQIR